MRRTLPVVLILSIASAACSRSHDDNNVFSWSRELAPGGTLRVRNTNGTVTVVPSTDGKTARVQAAAHWRRGDPRRDLKFVAQSAGSDAIICVHWGTGTCTATEYTSRRAGGLSGFFLRHGTDAKVDFTIEVPTGTRVDVSTLNGTLSVTAQAPVAAHTLNGSVHVWTAVGPVAASSVNGSVDVRMTTLGGPGEVRAETTNGDASAYVPQHFEGTVSLRTTNGEVGNAFGLAALAGAKNHIDGVLGNGARNVTVRTTNGSAMLGALDAQGKVMSGAAR